jgi:hypothetical protein
MTSSRRPPHRDLEELDAAGSGVPGGPRGTVELERDPLDHEPVGAVDDEIPAGAYITGNETIGVRA